MAAIDKVIWLDQGWQPVSIGFVASERAWADVMKRLKANEPWPGKSTACAHTQWMQDENGAAVVLVAIWPRDGHRDVDLIATLVHEAVHVWQFLCEQIGECAPGREMEAYGIQKIAEQLIGAWQLTIGGGKKLVIEP